MGLRVIWTEHALEDYRLLVEYLSANWPANVVLDFIDTLETRLETLSVFPNMELPPVRIKQELLFYQNTTNFITRSQKV